MWLGKGERRKINKFMKVRRKIKDFKKFGLRCQKERFDIKDKKKKIKIKNC